MADEMKPEQWYLLVVVFFLLAVILIYATPGIPDEAATEITGIASVAFGMRSSSGY
jgi:hypothetical protein